MSIPTEVTNLLQDGLIDALSVAAMSLIVVISVVAIKYMRRAIDGVGANDYSSDGFTSDWTADDERRYVESRSGPKNDSDGYYR